MKVALAALLAAAAGVLVCPSPTQTRSSHLPQWRCFQTHPGDEDQSAEDRREQGETEESRGRAGGNGEERMRRGCQTDIRSRHWSYPNRCSGTQRPAGFVSTTTSVRHRLCLVCSTAFVAETLPVPCISTAFVAKTLSLSCVSTAVYYRPLPTTAVHCHSYTFFSTFHCLDDPPQRSTTTPT